jgi:hypothetical protein
MHGGETEERSLLLVILFYLDVQTVKEAVNDRGENHSDYGDEGKSAEEGIESGKQLAVKCAQRPLLLEPLLLEPPSSWNTLLLRRGASPAGCCIARWV